MDLFNLDFIDLQDDAFRAMYLPYLQEQINGKATSDEYGTKVTVRCYNYSNHMHGDKSYSAMVNITNGVYFCSVCGSYSPYKFLTELGGLTKEQASTELSSYLGDDKRFPKLNSNYVRHYGYAPKGLTKFCVDANKRLLPSLPIVQEYIDTKGISFSTLNDAGIGYLPASPNQIECLVFPYYVNGSVNAVRGRSLDGRKGGIAGSRFIPYGLDLLTSTTCIICEGESDTLITRQTIQALGIDASVVGIPGSHFRREFDREFSDVETIIVVPQADEPSAKFSQQVIKVLGNDRVTISPLPWKKGEVGKDVADWMMLHNTEDFRDVVKIKPKRKIFYTTDELKAEAQKPIPYLIDGLLARGDKVLIGGEQKSMKTYFTLFMIDALANGTMFLDKFTTKLSNVLFVEEEGSIAGLGARIHNVNLPSNVIWMHKPSIKLDTGKGLKEIYETIEENDIDVLVLDPLQRMHNRDEDSSSEMSVVWDRIHDFTTRYPNLAVIVIHHFRKNGGENASWNSFRGSNRGAGEVDLGFFISRLKNLEHETQLQITVDGRDIPAIDIDNSTPGKFTVCIDTKQWLATVKNTISLIPELDNSTLTLEQRIRNSLVQSGGMSLTALAEDVKTNRPLVTGSIHNLMNSNNVRKAKKDVGNGRVGVVYEWIGD